MHKIWVSAIGLKNAVPFPLLVMDLQWIGERFSQSQISLHGNEETKRKQKQKKEKRKTRNKQNNLFFLVHFYCGTNPRFTIGEEKKA